jgi:hypothetical protein
VNLDAFEKVTKFVETHLFKFFKIHLYRTPHGILNNKEEEKLSY